MSYHKRSAASSRRLVRRFGGGATVTVRTPSTLENPSTGQAVTNLQTVGTTAEDATTITLDAATLEGTLPSGAQITISGQVYTTTADVTAASNALTDVAITPGAVAEIANNTAATVTQAYGETSYPAARQGFRRSEIDGELVQADDYLLLVATSTELDIEDVISFDGERQNVVSIQPFSPGSTQAATRLHCRS